ARVAAAARVIAAARREVGPLLHCKITMLHCSIRPRPGRAEVVAEEEPAPARVHLGAAYEGHREECGPGTHEGTLVYEGFDANERPSVPDPEAPLAHDPRRAARRGAARRREAAGGRGHARPRRPPPRRVLAPDPRVRRR